MIRRLRTRGFTAKAIFSKKDETYRIITGSSNLTKTALTSNIEWNTRIISTEQGEIAADILSEFDRLWNSEYSIGFDEFFEVYKERYSIIKKQREIAASEKIVSLQKYTLKPNSMQEQFIVNLKKMIEKGEDRVILISSTGVGIIIQTGYEKPVNSTVYGVSETCLFSYIS